MRIALARSVLLLGCVALMAAECPGDSPTDPPSLGISLSSAQLSIARGASATVDVSITRANLTSPVTLTVDGLPNGVTGNFTPATVNEGTSSTTLALTASASAAIGSAGLTVRANATGVPESTASIALNVTDSQQPAGTTPINLPLCVPPGDNVLWFGYQNQGGAWTRVIPNNGIASFQATSKVAIRLVHQAPSTGGVGFVANDVAYLTAEELNQFPACPAGATTLHGNIAGLSGSHTARVSIHSSAATIVPPSSSFTLSNIPSGAVDLVAHRNVVSGSTTTPNAIIVRRSLNLASGVTMPLLDFAAAEAMPPASSSVTITGQVAGEQNFASLTLTTGNQNQTTIRTLADLWDGDLTGNSVTVPTLPIEQSAAGDIHQLSIFADATSSNRAVFLFFRTPGPKAATFGPPLATPTVTTVASSPIARMRVQLNSQPEYDDFINWGVNQSTQDLWVTVSAAYLNGTPTNWDVTHPDMTGASDWDNAWGLKAGQSSTVYVLAASGSVYLVTGAVGLEGESARYAERVSETSTMLRTSGAGRRMMRRGFVGFGTRR